MKGKVQPSRFESRPGKLSGWVRELTANIRHMYSHPIIHRTIYSIADIQFHRWILSNRMLGVRIVRHDKKTSRRKSTTGMRSSLTISHISRSGELLLDKGGDKGEQQIRLSLKCSYVWIQLNELNSTQNRCLISSICKGVKYAAKTKIVRINLSKNRVYEAAFAGVTIPRPTNQT